MAKIRLGQTPATFKRKVSFKMVDGSDASIEITYKYRTRSEFGAFIDKLMADAGESPKAGDEEKFSMAALMEKTAGANADYIIQVAEAWNLIGEDGEPVDFEREAVQQLADEFPEAAAAIMETYRLAVTGARLGN